MTPTMYPYLSYRDAAGALRFLEESFGFTITVRWDAPAGTVQQAEATFRDGALIWQKRGRHERAQRHPERGSCPLLFDPYSRWS